MFSEFFGIGKSNCILSQIFIVIERKIKIQDRYLYFSNPFSCAFETQALMYLMIWTASVQRSADMRPARIPRKKDRSKIYSAPTLCTSGILDTVMFDKHLI